MSSHTQNQPQRQNSPSAHLSNSHSTGAANYGRWSTQRIAVYALFVALTMVVSFFSFPIIPGTNFLKYDPSGIVVLVAGFAFGPAAAAIISVLGFLPHLFTDPFGALIAILVALSLSLPAALIYRKVHTRKGALLGIVVGAVAALAMAILCNILITPFYAHMSVQAVMGMIVPILLPFNVLKFTIHGVVTFLVYKPISQLVNR
ncbi:riboflavin transporter [Bombiscardovia apis]|uniref:Riboflavin transporter n=2 Tax=Bombiscardovia apis TaxID=2932182 RepID=A0ABN6SFY9_9BIFI|nr:ECF transporter S component [Bombiscardovia apis]BDR54914.1 riboflavin transporter [Bombiscardovia apis]